MTQIKQTASYQNPKTKKKKNKNKNKKNQEPHTMQELPPGFRFFPVEEELVDFYLRNKLEGKREDIDCVIRVVDIYSIEPWDLPSKKKERIFCFIWFM